MEREVVNQENGITVEDYFNKGVDAAKQGSYDSAIENFNKAISLAPNDLNCADVYYNRGVAYGHKDEYDSAIEDFNEAIRLSPNRADAYYNRGYSYVRKGNYDKACNDFDEAIRIDPNYNVAAYEYLGRCHVEKDEINRAIAVWEMGLKIDPANKDIKTLLDTAHNLINKNEKPSEIIEIEKEVKTLLIFAIVGAVIGGILGIAGGGGGFVGGIWFGCGFGCAIEYIRGVSLLDFIKENGFSEGLKLYFRGGLLFLVLFLLGGPIGLLIRYFKIKKQ